MQITLQITGDKEVIAKLRKLGQSMYLMESAMREVGRYLTNYYENESFASQGQVWGKTWPPLSSITLARRGHTDASAGLSKNHAAFVNFIGKQKSNRSSIIGTSTFLPLVTGNPDGMQHSFAYRTTETSATMFNTKDYFKYHQSSAPRKSNLPRRQMMGINELNKAMIRKIVKEDLAKKLATV